MASPTVQKVGLETNGPLEGKRLCGLRGPSTLYLPVVQADVCLGRDQRMHSTCGSVAAGITDTTYNIQPRARTLTTTPLNML